MPWVVLFQEEFDSEFEDLAEHVQDELLAHAKHANMKELRFDWKREVWRVAFAFDPKRQAILRAAGEKGGTDQKRFYKRLIATADRRFDNYLAAFRAIEIGKQRKEKGRGKKS